MIAGAIAGGVELVVNLGAGLDTRPYRMELPATLAWLEVDQKSIIAHKNERLAEESPRCHLDRIAADLTELSSRHELFADIGSRAGSVLVITEGLVPIPQVPVPPARRRRHLRKRAPSPDAPFRQRRGGPVSALGLHYRKLVEAQAGQD